MEHMERKPFFSIVVAVILMAGLLGATFVAANAYRQGKVTAGKITVTGSAKKQIKSDFAVWKGTFSTQAKTISEAYGVIKRNQSIVSKYLTDKGIPESEISISAINTTVNYAKTINGIMTSNAESYKLSQTVEVRTGEIDKIIAISRQSTELIDKGVEFQSHPPQYFYTKIADLKVDMLALATKDAAARAEQIAANSGASVVGLQSAKMGVFQITPLYSNEISDYGINDTSSIDKEIMAVMNCEFKTK